VQERQKLVRAAKKFQTLNTQAGEARRAMWVAMAEARRGGMTLQEIADVAGISRQRVMEILNS
jgi:DNA-directed RNA polymerase sigma subunit (sigma70/sigma32)